jgi:hypothetical protein
MSELCPFEVVPYKITAQPNKPAAVSLNYTNQDFWSLKARLVAFTKERFGNQFTDFIESSLAMMLIENWAFIGDTLSYKIDQIANEVFIDTVTELDNAFRLAKLVGYKPLPPVGGVSRFTARMTSTQDINISVPTPLSIPLVADNTTFFIELFAADQYNRPIYDENIVIPAGDIVNSSIVGIEGQSYTDVFIGNGEINQTLVLQYFPVLMDSIRVYVDGVRWEEVEFFTDSKPRTEYRADYNSNFQTFIIFGNNRAGLLPPNGSAIEVRYRAGGGTIGNIVSNYATFNTVIPIEGRAYTVQVEFNNYTRGQFGSAGDSVEDIRRKLPAYNRAQDRAVTASDYKDIVDLFATAYNGVTGKSVATLRHSGCSANIIEIIALVRNGADGLAKPSSQFKAELNEYLSGKKMMTDYLSILDGEIILVDVTLQVYLAKQNKVFQDNIDEKIRRNLAIFFNVQNWEFGQPIRDIDILKALSTVDEPYRYELCFTTLNNGNCQTSISSRYFEIIRPGNIIINYTYE